MVALILFVGLLPVSLILPAFRDWGLSAFDQQRWLQLGAASAVLVIVGCYRAYWRYWLFSTRVMNGLWIAVLVSGAVSVALSPRPLISLTEGLYFLALVALIQAGRFLRAWEPFWFDRLVRASLYLSAGCYACVLVVGLVVAAGYPHPTHEYLTVSFNNVRFFGDYALLQVLLVFVGARACQRPGRAVLVILAAIFWLMLLLMGGRAVLIAWAGALFFVYVFRRGMARRFLTDQILALLLGLLAMGLLKIAAVFPETGFSRDWLTDSGRLELWGLALRQWLAHPWFGAGPMELAAAGGGATAAHTHNLALQWLAEWGLVPTLLVLILLLRSLTAVLAKLWSGQGLAEDEHDDTVEPALAVLAAVAILAMVDGVLYGVPAAQLFVLAATIFWSRYRDCPAGAAASGQAQTRATGTGLVATLALVGLLSLGSWQVREAGLQCLDQGRGVIERPRLWLANRLCEPDRQR